MGRGGGAGWGGVRYHMMHIHTVLYVLLVTVFMTSESHIRTHLCTGIGLGKPLDLQDSLTTNDGADMGSILVIISGRFPIIGWWLSTQCGSCSYTKGLHHCSHWVWVHTQVEQLSGGKGKGGEGREGEVRGVN